MLRGEAIDVGGVNPWEHDWTKFAKAPVELPHPSYPRQLHRFWLYRVTVGQRSVTFAAGELSANVWGFYQRLV